MTEQLDIDHRTPTTINRLIRFVDDRTNYPIAGMGCRWFADG